MDRGIAQSGTARRRPRAPDHERGGDRHQLPENEHGEQVAREGDADGASRVARRGGKLGGVALIEREQSAGEGHDGEDGREQARERVALDERKRVAEEAPLERDAVGHLPDEIERDQRQHQERKPAQPLVQERQNQAADNQDGGRRDANDASCHSRCPAA